VRANERFSGKGHARHICRECAALPRAERDTVLETDEIFAFLHQSHISERNVARLAVLARSQNAEIARLASTVLEVARVKPYKTKRLGFLARNHRGLLRKLEETGLILAHHW
jgi:hypothetical protein